MSAPALVVNSSQLTSTSGSNISELRGYSSAEEVHKKDAEEDEAAATNSYAIPCFLACISVFAGYSSLVSLQKRVRDHLGNGVDKNAFDIAASCTFYAIGVMRVAHSFMFPTLTPRERVFLGYGLLATAILLLVIVVFLLDLRSVAFCGFVYTLGGAGIGCFECNYVSAITPLGPAAKRAALLSMPIGYTGISIFAFSVFAADPHDVTLVWCVFLFTVICVMVSAVVFCVYVPPCVFEASAPASLSTFIVGVTNVRVWIADVYPCFITMFVNMFVVGLLSSAPEYIYTTSSVPLFSKSGSEATVPRNVMLAVFFALGGVGDFVSRIVAYRVDMFWWRGAPMEQLVLVIAGCIAVLSRIGFLCWLGCFCALFANGMIYAMSIVRLDFYLKKSEYHLIATSFWLMTGDVGSSLGSSLTHTLSKAVGAAG